MVPVGAVLIVVFIVILIVCVIMGKEYEKLVEEMGLEMKSSPFLVH